MSSSYGTVPKANALLDDLEAATRNIYIQTTQIQGTVLGQNRKLDGLRDEMEETSQTFQGQHQILRTVREEGQNLCWMYTLIALESMLFLYLLLSGLS